MKCLPEQWPHYRLKWNTLSLAVSCMLNIGFWMLFCWRWEPSRRRSMLSNHQCVEHMWGNLMSLLHHLRGFISALFLFLLQLHSYMQRFFFTEKLFPLVKLSLVKGVLIRVGDQCFYTSKAWKAHANNDTTHRMSSITVSNGACQ